VISTAQLLPMSREVAKTLKIDTMIIAFDFLTEKVLPNQSDQTILVLPVFDANDEGYYEDDFSLSVYILIVDNTTNEIVSEVPYPMNLCSDAVQLNGIRIDIAPYQLNDSTRAFGVVVQHYIDSRASPYSVSELYLFVKTGANLVEVLKGVEMSSFSGEMTDSYCINEETSKNVLIILNTKTNGYYDLLLKSKVIHINRTAENDCEGEIVKEVAKKISYKFNGTNYQLVK